MKVCTNCGSILEDRALFCSQCGAKYSDDNTVKGESESAQKPVSDNSQEYKAIDYQPRVYSQHPVNRQPAVFRQPVNRQPAPFPPPVNQRQVPLAKGAMAKAIIGLVFGIAGLIFCFIPIPLISIILSVVGIIFGVKARNAIPAGQKGRGLANAGFICSIIGIALGGLFTACGICAVICGKEIIDHCGCSTDWREWFGYVHALDELLRRIESCADSCPGFIIF